MRHLLCAKCATKRTKGKRLIYERSPIGEPAEYERVTFGVAALPEIDQRTVRVNGDPTIMSLDFYNCDSCNAEIRPGDRCAARTVWNEEQAEPARWEEAYFSKSRSAT